MSPLRAALFKYFAMYRSTLRVIGGAVLILTSFVVLAQAVGFGDSLDIPARKVLNAARSTVTSVTSQDGRVVAVGPRGLILVSSDGGKSWRQEISPVSTDLVTVRFTGPDTIWAVGHDAVALRSIDGGTSWRRMLDGREVLALMREHAKGSEKLEAEIDRTMDQSASPDVWPAPILDIRFMADGLTGYAVGGFGLILQTTDGGQKWRSLQGTTDNHQRFHLYALTGRGNELFVAGEQGLVMRLDVSSQRFKRVETPYNGSFFGIDRLGSNLLAYGLRGNAYVSADDGGTWKKIDTQLDANFVSAMAYGRSALLVSQSGEILTVDLDAARATKTHTASGAEVYGAALVGSERIALTRLNGIDTVAVVAPSK